MNWRYALARRLNLITLIISVVMMVLLPWPKKEVKKEETDAGDAGC